MLIHLDTYHTVFLAITHVHLAYEQCVTIFYIKEVGEDPTGLMCITAFAWQLFADKPLILLSNRDEFLARPTQSLHQWTDDPIIAGQDLQSGGTWLGINPHSGQWAIVLNFREVGMPVGEVSRGRLITDFLTQNISPKTFAKQIRLTDYTGFNLVVGNRQQAIMLNNRGYGLHNLPAGLYTISNGQPNEDWFKTERLRGRVRQEILPLIASQQAWHAPAWRILQDTDQAALHQLPATGLPETLEHSLSSIYIDQSDALPDYGTRVSTLLTLTHTGYDMIEKDHQTNTIKRYHS